MMSAGAAVLGWLTMLHPRNTNPWWASIISAGQE